MTTDDNKKNQPKWPDIFNRYLNSMPAGSNPPTPRKETRRYHGMPVTLWFGLVNYQDIEGWVENVRIKHYLSQWRKHVNDPARIPTTDDIYKFMLEADDSEKKQSAKPFHLERMAESISSNGIQEPVFVHVDTQGAGTLWDGNRRRYGTHHIMLSEEFKPFRDTAQWMPAYVHESTGDPMLDEKIQHAVLTEQNFKEKDHIPWPNFVKAGEIFRLYNELIKDDPTSPTARRVAQEQLAEEFGLPGWRTAGRWVKMYGLAEEFKAYQIETHERDEIDVDLFSQTNFEYFDEISRNGVWGRLNDDDEARSEVFDWFWDEKFIAWRDVRKVPQILDDPEARRLANTDDKYAIREAIKAVYANDPVRKKDKSTANERIVAFAEWLNTFNREDYLKLEKETLEKLEEISSDTVKILKGLEAEVQQAS